jgi:hypothetical protein
MTIRIRDRIVLWDDVPIARIEQTKKTGRWFVRTDDYRETPFGTEAVVDWPPRDPSDRNVTKVINDPVALLARVERIFELERGVILNAVRAEATERSLMNIDLSGAKDVKEHARQEATDLLRRGIRSV